MPYLFSVGGIGNIRYLCTVKKGNKRAGGPPREKNKQYNQQKRKQMEKKYYCTVCEWIYDPEVGDPDSGIAPGTRFEDIPEDWACPVCGVTKENFVIVEE